MTHGKITPDIRGEIEKLVTFPIESEMAGLIRRAVQVATVGVWVIGEAMSSNQTK